MGEQKSKKDTPEENESLRPLPDAAEKVDHAEKQGRSGERDSGQTDYYIWGLSRYEFLTIVLGFIVIIAGVLQWRASTIATRHKERPRIAYFDMRREPAPPLSFSLTFKNVGETTALNAKGVWLGGECPYTSSQECVNWCLRPLREERGSNYGSLRSQDEHTEEFFYALKTGKARKKQRRICYCGYFAYTDVFCMWHRQFYAVLYDPATDGLSSYDLDNQEEEAEVRNCSPRRLY
jgi:hypothetical protein